MCHVKCVAPDTKDDIYFNFSVTKEIEQKYTYSLKVFLDSELIHIEQIRFFHVEITEDTYTTIEMLADDGQEEDFDYKQPQYVRMFITSFVDDVYINKNKKIAVVVNVDNSLFITTSPKCVYYSSMVELKRIELSTS